MFSLLLAGALLTPPAPSPEPPRPTVGGFVLLTDRAAPVPGVPRSTLTDAQGHPVLRTPWVDRPLKVVRETPTAYVLAQGAAQVWLPKSTLGTPSVFPLFQNAHTTALTRQLGQKSVYVNGQPLFPCEVVPGYHALVTLKTARVSSVWWVAGDLLNRSPQGGPVQGELTSNKRRSAGALLVMLTPVSEVNFMAAALEPQLQDQSAELIAQVPQRCTALAGLYADANSLRRTLTTVQPPRFPALPNDPDAQQRALIGWTQAQILARYGSPNETGSLNALLKLRQWTYGTDAYSMLQFSFGPDHRVTQAVVGRSP